MTALASMFGITAFLGLLLAALAVAAWAKAAGVLREGSRLHRWVTALLNHVDKVAALLFVLLGLAIARKWRKPDRGPVLEQVRDHAAVRRKARDARADVAAKFRETQAHTEGVVVDIRIDAENRVEAIRRDAAGMDDDALRAEYEAARGRHTK